MRQFQLRVSRWTLRFSSLGALAVIALGCAAVLLTFFVGTLHDSMQRGELLRQAQRSGASITPTPSAAAAPALVSLAQ